MKDIVVDVLARESLICNSKKPKINILLSGTIGFEVFLNKDLLYFVKLSVCEERACDFDIPYFDLQSEHQSQVESYSIFPEFVAEPVGYYQQDIFNLLVCSGVSCLPINSYEIHGNGKIFEKLKLYFKKAKSGLSENSKNKRNITLLEKVLEGTDVAEHNNFLKKWLSGDKLKVLEKLDEVSQHGDFSINNVALTKQKQLVIFDWEDMGKVYLPGFDLFTLVVSILNFDKVEVIKLLEGKSNYRNLSSFVEETCGVCFIDSEKFKKLFPVYIAVFIFLKKRYSVGVREKAIGLMDEVLCVL